MYKVLFVSFLVCFASISKGQNEDHQWLFNWTSGDDLADWPDLGASVLDFNTLPPRAYRDISITLDMGETNASICDENGEFLYYSNGMAIHSGMHESVLNGDTISYVSGWHTLTWPNENGEVFSAGHRYIQSIGFIPKPENEDTTYVVYQNYTGAVSGGYMDLQFGKLILNEENRYEILYKDASINDRILDSGNIHACRHGNGRDWWMLQFSRDTVYTYLIDPDGINLSHLQFLPFELRRGNGQSKFSPNGNFFALYHRFRNEEPDGMDLMISRFDRCSGNLIDPIYEKNSSISVGVDTGIEFSPNERLLYISKPVEVFQYDLTSQDIFSSKTRVAVHDDSKDTLGCYLWFGQMQLAPDNKIYIGRSAQCFNIHVINSPNEFGESCDVKQNVISLPTYTVGAVPNFNTYRLGPLDGSICDTLGNDNKPISRFWYEQDGSNFLSVQLWDVSYFRPENWEWDFGDGNTSSERHPMHNYLEKGIYDVCLTVSNENTNHISCQELNIGTVSSVVVHENFDISVFPNPTEGFTRITFHNYLPQDAYVQFYNFSGSLFMTKNLSSGANMLDLSELPSGTYLYDIIDQGVTLSSGQIVRI